MRPYKLIIFSLENTGKGDLRDMELSGLTEYRKMFKKQFEVNLLDHPYLFNKEVPGE